jgi:hypothetical protein
MGAKLTIGDNDLLTRLPDLAREAFGWDPSMVCYGSRKVLPWKGVCGHTWEAEVHSRSSKGHGCPYCSGKKILLGFNDLVTIAPELAKEAYNWNPQDFTSGSKVNASWKGKCGHIWNAQIKNSSGAIAEVLVNSNSTDEEFRIELTYKTKSENQETFTVKLKEPFAEALALDGLDPRVEIVKNVYTSLKEDNTEFYKIYNQTNELWQKIEHSNKSSEKSAIKV